MIHRNLLLFRGARYLWWSLGLLVMSGVLYATQGNVQPPNGGTWQGYVLGSIGALLIIATLHSGFQVGWNVHTLAYVLMIVVIASGFFGLFSYLNHPVLISKNREGGGRAELFAELFELDKQSRSLAQKCAPEVGLAVASSIERTTLGGGVYSQLFSGDNSFFVKGAGAPVRNTDQQAVIDYVAERLPRAQKGIEAANLQQLIVLLCRRQAILRRIRRDIRLRGWLKIWLYFHIPVTVALLVALVVHIVSTFVYW